MPRFDGTGPRGMGAGTGWENGPCCGGGGWGRGFGRRQFFTKKEEKDILEDNMKEMEQEILAMKERLAQIKDQK